MARDPHHSQGDDGSLEARMARLENGAASGDWLAGRVAAIDAHLERATKQLDDLGDRIEARLDTLDARLERVAKAVDAHRDESAKRAAPLAHADQWVSSLPPGWRRVVAWGTAVVVLVLQVVSTLRALEGR